MEDQVYLRTTGIQNILHINQPTRAILKKERKEKKKKHTVVELTAKHVTTFSSPNYVLKEIPR